MGGSIFEAGMLIFFGFSWPVSIIKSLRSRSAKGKSGIFTILVATGYIFGITHKILYSRDIVLALYLINITMISIDIALWFRNRKLDAEAEAKEGLAAGQRAADGVDEPEAARKINGQGLVDGVDEPETGGKINGPGVAE